MSEINKEIESEILRRSWFYRFQLPCGEITESYLPEDVLKIHETREQMMIHVLDDHFEGQWQNLKCIDLACHQGDLTNSPKKF